MRPLRLALRLALPVALTASLACAGARRGELCRESRDLRCLTERECAPDRSRGCLVCTCKPWDAPPAREGAAAGALPEGNARPPPSPAR